MSGRWDALVLGGGANALAAAAALARAGRRTLLLAEEPELGGQTRSGEFAPAFRTCPLGLDAGWVPPAVVHGLGLTLPARTRPAVPLGAAGQGGEWLTLPADLPAAQRVIARHSARDAARWPAFCARVARQTGVLARLAAGPPPDIATTAPGELLSLLRTGLALRRLGKTELVELLRAVPMAVQEQLDDHFESPLLKAAVATAGIASLRFGPRAGGTGFRLLHGQLGAPPGAIRGRGFWTAGPDALIGGLATLARSRGAELRAGARLRGIRVEEDRVGGVTLDDGSELHAPLVLSCLNPRRTLLELLDPVWLDPELLLALRNLRYRGVTSFVSFALDGLPDFPGLPDPADSLQGILSLTGTLDDLERGADATKYGSSSAQLHVELEIPSLRWPALAPPGRHVLIARVQWTPFAPRGGWDAAARDRLADQASAAIAERAPGFTARVLHREALLPPDLEARFGLPEGAASHGELALDQILFMRPVAGLARYATPVDGLYLGGAGCHPGPGIPGGAGWLAARQVLTARS